MPTTRKKVIKTVYKNDDSEEETGDFSDSGSDAQISEPPSSDEEEIEENILSDNDFGSKPNKSRLKQPIKRKPKFAKEFLHKITKQIDAETEENDVDLPLFSVKDLSDADKLLPSVLNLSESDSSDDETPKAPKKKGLAIPISIPEENVKDDDNTEEYTNIWTNIPDNSAEIAKKTFMELEKHKCSIEETKASIQSYMPSTSIAQTQESNVTDLLALGEDIVPKKSAVKRKRKGKRAKDDSDSEVEDWEEVKESKAIPQQGLQLIVELPDSVCRKSKKIDVEMMMKRKMNRVKKEHQVFMHKVHVLCWLGHGNYVSSTLNDQEIMAAVLSMVPQGCYPDSRLNMKYVEQITEWFNGKLTLKQDKYENKFRPKAPPLKNILLDQIKSRLVTTKKYIVFIFVAMLRALGLQCRIMFNFVTVPLKPPSSELCSLSTKPKDAKNNIEGKKAEISKPPKLKSSTSKADSKLPQIDGNYDSLSSDDSEFEHAIDIDDGDEMYCESVIIMQVDGNDDAPAGKTRTTRSTRVRKAEADKLKSKEADEDVSPPKIFKKTTEPPEKLTTKNGPVLNSKKSDSIKNKKLSNTRKTKNNNKTAAEINNSTTSIKTISDLQTMAISTTPKIIFTDENGIETSAVTYNKEAGKLAAKKDAAVARKSPKSLSLKKSPAKEEVSDSIKKTQIIKKLSSPRKTRSNSKTASEGTNSNTSIKNLIESQSNLLSIPSNVMCNTSTTLSKYFEEHTKTVPARKRSCTSIVNENKSTAVNTKSKTRTKSASSIIEKSKYFEEPESMAKKSKLKIRQQVKQEKIEDMQRVSHKDLIKPKEKSKFDVTDALVNILKDRIKGAKEEGKRGIVKGKIKEESDDDSDYLPVEDPKRRNSQSDDDFKPTKISHKSPKLSPGVKPSTSKKRIDRRVLSSDDEPTKPKLDVWCEIFVEELEQWVAVDVVNGKVHCTSALYSHATHPVCYIIGWDNNNYLKDLTRRYVPQWNTVTRKQRAEHLWWRTAIQPWLGPRNARDREEDEALDRMQLEAPLPKSISEYKNHPLYALKRHLLKFEAIYPPDAQTLGFVRSEAVYARECVYVCRSRDTWLKEAKVVKMGEKPYKVVKARPKWDKLSNKMITDKPLEVFGPWQVKDYEPPTAENGRVPRNAYGNVELFKECMLPKGTVHIKLPGLNKVARKLNIDCAPAMTGFDFNGGWSHPVYDGFVVCEEFGEIVTDAWVKDQEEQERKECEKVEQRVFGNWKRLIRGLLIRERLKYKYGFEKPASQPPKSKKGPRHVVKKNF